jgi:predicted RND superfamily exporter protein
LKQAHRDEGQGRAPNLGKQGQLPILANSGYDAKERGMKETGMLERLSGVIVDRRNLLFLFYIIAIIFSLFSMGWVDVENDIVYFLAEDSKTRQGLTVMSEEFTTFGMADIMISNITYGHAREVADKIGAVHGVAQVVFENTDDHYKDSSALFAVIFEGDDADEISQKAMEEIQKWAEKWN